MLDFRNLTFSSANHRTRVILPSHSKFRLHRTIWSRVTAKKVIFNMASVRHLEFENFWFFSHISVDWVKMCIRIPNVVIFGRFAAELWSYSDFQNGGRPPCWIYCDVIILYMKTESNDLDIVINSDVHTYIGFILSVIYFNYHVSPF